ncbi:hypothetical protein PS1_033520 [Malus domestica]
MAPKRPSPLDEPTAASSAEDEKVSSEEGEEDESGSGAGSELEEPLPSKTSSSAPVLEKKPPSKKPDSSVANSKPESSSSGSEADSDSDMDNDWVVKPIASKPMKETPKTNQILTLSGAETHPALLALLSPLPCPPFPPKTMSFRVNRSQLRRPSSLYRGDNIMRG